MNLPMKPGNVDVDVPSLTLEQKVRGSRRAYPSA